MTGDSVVEIITEYVQTGVFSQQYIKSGAGSGVIIDTEGYIVTNHHVIENAEKISVTLRNGENYSAELIGSDAKMDLALLKIKANKLTAAVFGNSDELKVGQRTVAIGNPLGQLGGTVTEGIISALDRDVTVDGQTMNLLQTDTAINPGNSGGGLFDGKGNLIGIVVAKSSGTEVEGLGFAIPINDAVDVISDLIDYGYVRGRIAVGMEFIDVDSEPVAWMYGLSDLGCYVYRVDSDSNAEEAGFKSGDLILSVDGVEVDTSDEVEAQLDKKTVGDAVEFKVKRGRKTGTLTLILEEYVPDKGFGNSDDVFIEWGY
ncbi:MAG: trypsin-like peptidase domain-containing protein [Ruminococcus sp.]|nr:trypsin-like peptidase domain-containing protein [Ruminococcus sp.]